MKKVFSLILSVLFAVNLMAAENLVTNGNFEDGTNGWTLTYQQSADANVYVIATTDGLVISQPKSASGRLDILQDIAVTRNKEYTLSFEYKANFKKFRIWSFLVSNNDTWVYFTDDAKTDPFRTKNGYFEVAEDFVSQSMDFKVPDVDTLPTFRLMFRVYKTANCEISLRKVVLTEKGVITNFENKETFIEQKKFFKNGILYFRNGEKVYDMNGNIVEE